MITVVSDNRLSHQDATDGARPGVDWLLRVDRSDRTLSATGGRTVTQGTLTGFVAGTISAVSGSVPTDVEPVETAKVLASLTPGSDAGLDALRGWFVLAVADRATGTARLVRDPLGTHPLFYTVTPHAYLFAALPQTLLRQPGVSHALNRATIADQLCMRDTSRTDTFFEAVRRVPAGHRVLISAQGVDTSRYWHPLAASRSNDATADDDVERFGALLDLAVRRSVTGHRAAVFLSGGFDSISVAAAMCDVEASRSRPVPLALSVDFPDPECGERDIQTAVANRLGMPLSMITLQDAIGPRGLLRGGLELNAQLAAPLFNTWLPAYMTLRDCGVRQGVDVILTGEGGDEWLGVSPFLAADLLRRGDVAGLARLIRTWKRSYRHKWTSVIRATLFRFGLRPLVGQFCHRIAPAAWDARRTRRVMQSTPSWISPDPELQTALYARAHQNLAEANPPDGFYTRECRTYLDHPVPSWTFEEQHAVNAPHGIRFVHPYWDADLLAHMYNVPPARLHHGDRTKALVRRAVDRRFPGLGFNRQRKVTATDFFVGLVKREAPTLAIDVADFRGLASLDVVTPAAARDFVASAWNGSAYDVSLAWKLVNVEAWVRRQLGWQ